MTDQAVTADEQGEALVTHPCGVCGTPLNAEQDAFHDCVADSEDEREAREYSSLLALLVGTEADGENTLAMNQARALLASDWLLAREQAAAATALDEAAETLAATARQQNRRATLRPEKANQYYHAASVLDRQRVNLRARAAALRAATEEGEK